MWAGAGLNDSLAVWGNLPYSKRLKSHLISHMHVLEAWPVAGMCLHLQGMTFFRASFGSCYRETYFSSSMGISTFFTELKSIARTCPKLVKDRET